MTLKTAGTLLGGLALASLLALPLAAQKPETMENTPSPEAKGMAMDNKAMAGHDADMEAMMKAATPGENHKAIARLVGDWTFTNKMWMDPSQPAMESSGTVHGESILGGRYVRSTYKGDMGGMPFEGQSTDGYDNAAKQYVGSWVDNMGTGILYVTGSCDAAHKVCNASGDFVDPASGQTMTNRSVTTWTTDSSYTMEMFVKDPSGKEMKVMVLDAKKKS